MSDPPISTRPNTYFAKNLIEDCDRCVMCGLCLPHCPTYMLERRETDSPRGRISLMRALATEQLPSNTKLVKHLESCVLCRRCETVCPADVPFGKIMDGARQELFADQKTLARVPYWLELLVASRSLRRVCFFLIHLYRYSGLRWVADKIGLRTSRWMKNWEPLWPTRIPWLRYSKPAPLQQQTTDKKVITLFVGCIAEIMDSETLTAAKNLLSRAGFDVQIPTPQVCCGALHQHGGNVRYAATLALQNTIAFSATDVLISCATGCGIQLKEQQKNLGLEHFDITEFLASHATQLYFAPLADDLTTKKIMLHLPCTACATSNLAIAIKKLLEQLSGLEYHTFPETLSCCGAAGSYMLTHHESASTLANNHLDLLEDLDIDILMTLNFGCAAHLRQAAAVRHLNLEVIHPIVLLNRQLQTHTRSNLKH